VNAILHAVNLRKSFLSRRVLNDVSLHASSGMVVGVIGDNGSGKSTLVRILAGVLRQDAGSCALTVQGAEISTMDRPLHVGFVAPYIRLYDEFTATELLHIHGRLKGIAVDPTYTTSLLERIGLADRANDVISTLSSGLRQRVALAIALHHQPPVLILDEPSITLDTAGRNVLERELHAHVLRGGIAILATNDEREKDLCSDYCAL